MSKAVLEIVENVVSVKMVDDSAVDNMLKEFTCYAGERDWTVIFRVAFIRFFEEGDNVGRFPIVRD